VLLVVCIYATAIGVLNIVVDLAAELTRTCGDVPYEVRYYCERRDIDRPDYI
jgi:hypothetical protein